MVSVCDLPPAGGWLFYALYAANQQWWFLVICLSVWGFVLVALSFALSGREFLFPVALVTSFIGVWQTVTQLLLLLLHRCRRLARTLLVPLLSLECLASSLLVWCCQECNFQWQHIYIYCSCSAVLSVVQPACPKNCFTSGVVSAEVMVAVHRVADGACSRVQLQQSQAGHGDDPGQDGGLCWSHRAVHHHFPSDVSPHSHTAGRVGHVHASAGCSHGNSRQQTSLCPCAKQHAASKAGTADTGCERNSTLVHYN